jgi:hypothetical protein
MTSPLLGRALLPKFRQPKNQPSRPAYSDDGRRCKQTKGGQPG